MGPFGSSTVPEAKLPHPDRETFHPTVGFRAVTGLNVLHAFSYKFSALRPSALR